MPTAKEQSDMEVNMCISTDFKGNRKGKKIKLPQTKRSGERCQWQVKSRENVFGLPSRDSQFPLQMAIFSGACKNPKAQTDPLPMKSKSLFSKN